MGTARSLVPMKGREGEGGERTIIAEILVAHDNVAEDAWQICGTIQRNST
jgi:hypothetical protein